GQTNLRVKVPNFLYRSLAHAASIKTGVCGKSVSATPALCAADAAAILRVHRGPVRPARRELEVALVEQHRDGIQVGGKGMAAKPRGFKGDGATSGERVEHRRKFSPTVPKHFRTGLGKDGWLLVQFLSHQPAQNTEKSLALLVLL